MLAPECSDPPAKKLASSEGAIGCGQVRLANRFALSEDISLSFNMAEDGWREKEDLVVQPSYCTMDMAPPISPLTVSFQAKPGVGCRCAPSRPESGPCLTN